jgi:tetratricopeptide (TPR) repeat protein
MELSRRTVQPHWFHFFGLVLMIILINLLGALALGLGLLVTIPVSWCALTAAYATMVGFQAGAQPLPAAAPAGRETAAPSGEGGPPPPSAGVAERSLAPKYDWAPVLILMGFIVVIAAAGIYFWKFAPPSAPPKPVGGPTETSRKPPRPLTAQDYFNKGNDAKDPREKILFFSKAIEQDPKFVPAYNNRGNVYYDRDEYELALKDYNKAIALKPDYVIAYHNRGRLYFDKMDYEKALKDMNKVIELKPTDAYSYNNLGNIYFRQKNYEGAINDYTKAITLKPDFSAAYSNRGNAYFHKEDYEKALADFNKALELKPDYVNAYYYRAILYKKTGAYDKARADYDKAASLNPRLLDAPFPLPEGK